MSETALLLETHAEIKNAQFSTIRELLLAQAKEHQLSVKENSDNRLVTQTAFGEFSFCTAGPSVRICIKSNSEDKLFMIKEGLVDHITHFMPDAANDLRWSDALGVGSRPPNFHFTEIQQLEPVGPCFTRVTVKLDNLETFNNDAIHFRLVLPPAELKDVVWPTVTENGSTEWPKGDKALHRPVYTTRFVDHEKSLMQFDIFHHDGGRATQWSRSAKVGDRLAIIGQAAAESR